MVRKTVMPSSSARRSTSSQSERAALRVQPGGRLVEEEDVGAVDQRQGEIEPPLHPARVAAHPPVGRLGEADALDQVVAARAALVLRDAMERRLQPHVLAGGQVRVQRRLLQGGRRSPREPRLPALRCRIHPPARSPPSAAAASSASAPSSTCRRRWGRGSRRSPPRPRAGPRRSTASGPFLNCLTRPSTSIARPLLPFESLMARHRSRLVWGGVTILDL